MTLKEFATKCRFWPCVYYNTILRLSDSVVLRMESLIEHEQPELKTCEAMAGLFSHQENSNRCSIQPPTHEIIYIYIYIPPLVPANIYRMHNCV
jgi:hypothetical protein